MPLTPIDVQQKTFGTALRGYDLDEVDDFLDEVVTSLKDYEQRLRDAQERIAQLESEVNDRGDAEGAIARALVAAQRSADAIVEEARAEAETIVAEARSKASELTAERDDERSRLQSEIDAMRRSIAGLRDRVRELAGSIDDDIEAMERAVEEAEASLEEEPPASRWSGTGIWSEDEAEEDAADESTGEIDSVAAEVEEAQAAVSVGEPADDTGSGERVPRPWEEV